MQYFSMKFLLEKTLTRKTAIVYFLLAGFGICSQWHLNTACSFRSVLFQNTSSLIRSTTVPT